METEELVPMIYSSAVSGGCLESWLLALKEQYGSRLRIVLEPIAMRFPLPCPTGTGEPLPAQALDEVLGTAQSFFSPELGCRYALLLQGQEAAMVLFDTEETAAWKRALLAQLGIRETEESRQISPTERRAWE